ncbi:MAG: Lipid export ATP-binding/permease protein MsbA, partial [Pseudomonadota bacterium]
MENKVITNKESIKQILKLYKRYIRKKYLGIIIVAFILMSVIALCTASVAYLVKPVINKIFINKNQTQLYVISTLLFLIVAVKSILTYFQNVTIHSLHELVIKDLRKEMFDKLVHLPLNQIQNMTNGRFVTY